MQWKVEWFVKAPNKHWQDKSNQRAFLLQLAKELEIMKMSDWGRVNMKTVIEHGGSSLLGMYGSSLYRTLQSVFPGNVSTCGN